MKTPFIDKFDRGINFILFVERMKCVELIKSITTYFLQHDLSVYPSKYVLYTALVTHPSQRFFHFWSVSWIEVSELTYSCRTSFSGIFFIFCKQYSFKIDPNCGKRWKLGKTISGEESIQGMTFVQFRQTRRKKD